MPESTFLMYVAVSALITYLLRSAPFVLVTKKIKNRFFRSFLYYVPYAVLSVMTIPGILYSTSYLLSALLGLITALILAYIGKSMSLVAFCSCVVVFITEFVISRLG